MLKRLILILLTLFAVVDCDCIAAQVKGYYRKDGTYVKPHQRKSSGKSAKSSSSSVSKENKSTSKDYTGKSWEVYQQRKEQGSRTFSKSMRQQKFEEQDGKCAHCGKKCSSVSEMDGDHIVPYSKGGKTVYSNLQMLCPHCNRSKGNKYSY